MTEYLGGDRQSMAQVAERVRAALRHLPCVDLGPRWQCRCGTTGYVRYRGRFYCWTCGRAKTAPDRGVPAKDGATFRQAYEDAAGESYHLRCQNCLALGRWGVAELASVRAKLLAEREQMRRRVRFWPRRRRAAVLGPPPSAFDVQETARRVAGWVLTPCLPPYDGNAHYYCPDCVPADLPSEDRA